MTADIPTRETSVITLFNEYMTTTNRIDPRNAAHSKRLEVTLSKMLVWAEQELDRLKDSSYKTAAPDLDALDMLANKTNITVDRCISHNDLAYYDQLLRKALLHQVLQQKLLYEHDTLANNLSKATDKWSLLNHLVKDKKHDAAHNPSDYIAQTNFLLMLLKHAVYSITHYAQPIREDLVRGDIITIDCSTLTDEMWDVEGLTRTIEDRKEVNICKGKFVKYKKLHEGGCSVNALVYQSDIERRGLVRQHDIIGIEKH